MDALAYRSMQDQQDTHWWFVGRRKIIRSIIASHANLGEDARVLEAGCGYGGNLPVLAEFGKVFAFEYNEQARSHAAAASGIDVRPGSLPDGVDFGGQRFDLIALFDVLEHVEDDLGSLRTLGRLLKPGGCIVLTVPAFGWLWSDHDEIHHHKRRYTRSGLRKIVEDAGLQTDASGYFNSLLFPLTLVQRVGSRFMGSAGQVERQPAAPLNAVLTKVFALEAKFVHRAPLPFGLSLYSVIRRRAD